MKLPIDVVVGTDPPKFKWRQGVSTPIGLQFVEYTSTLPPTVERAVADLVALAKRQEKEVERLTSEVASQAAEIERLRTEQRNTLSIFTSQPSGPEKKLDPSAPVQSSKKLRG